MRGFMLVPDVFVLRSVRSSMRWRPKEPKLSGALRFVATYAVGIALRRLPTRSTNWSGMPTVS